MDRPLHCLRVLPLFLFVFRGERWVEARHQREEVEGPPILLISERWNELLI